MKVMRGQASKGSKYLSVKGASLSGELCLESEIMGVEKKSKTALPVILFMGYYYCDHAPRLAKQLLEAGVD